MSNSRQARAWLLRAYYELIAFGVFEDRVFAPGLLLGLFHELDAALFELAISRLHVVAGEGTVEEGADAVLVTLGREQHDAGGLAADFQFNPALIAPIFVL